jgi:hypothetical protein
MVAVGKIVYHTKHADLGMVAATASRHYDDNGHVGAYVRAVNGRHGIWLSGVTRPGIDEQGLVTMRANPPSGDWRTIGNKLSLIAALAVPVPGFPVQRAMAASGALILEGYDGQEEIVEVEGRSKEFVRKMAMIRDSIDYLDVAAMTAAATTFTAKERQRLAKSGAAMADGSYPIRNCQDWMDARDSIGRTPPGKRAAVRAHINKRGRALGCGTNN